MKKPKSNVQSAGTNSSQVKTELKLDWCSHEAAKYAVEHWHYSKSMPACDLVKIGVWENNKFIGCVLFGRGAVANIGKPFGVEQSQACELVRIALTKHQNSVSKIVSIALRFLKRQCSGIRIVVSYADPAQKHHGGIYQAGNWVFVGQMKADREYLVKGQWKHHRTANSLVRSVAGLQSRPLSAKYKYIYPLDDEMRKHIEPLRKPYPKRPTAETETGSISNADTGGANPTVGLHMKNAKA